MKFTLGGQEIDLLTVTELRDTVEPMHKTLREFAKREKPTDQDVQTAATANAAGTATLDFGAPDASQVWDLRRVALSLQDATTIAAAAVRLYKREVSGVTLCDVGTQVPTVATYSRHQMTFKPGENVIVVVSGLIAATRVFGLLQAEQTRWQALERYSL